MFSSLPYNGIQSDLYALGVTLFVITFGWWPFQMATLDDIHFRKLVQNPVEFWKWHPETERRISENTVSPDLVKLINYMLCPYPQYRLSIKQIKQQKWYVDNLALATTLNVDQNSWTDSDVATEEAPDSDISSNEGENESSEDDIIC
jgi:serine/threonine protein kinase